MYSILSLDSEELVRDETLGTKTKYWFKRQEQFWLYKEAIAIPLNNGSYK